MPVSVLSVVLDADWEVATAFSKITISEIELFTLLTILNITGRLLSASTAPLECQLSANTQLTFLCPYVLVRFFHTFTEQSIKKLGCKTTANSIRHRSLRHKNLFPPKHGPLCERGQAAEIKWERWCKKGERRKKRDRDDDWEDTKRGGVWRRKTGIRSQEKNKKRTVVMDVKQSQVETRPKQINAKTTRQFTLSMSGELGFSSSMPEGLRGSNTGSGW